MRRRPFCCGAINVAEEYAINPETAHELGLLEAMK
jgi:hypothetical protein